MKNEPESVRDEDIQSMQDRSAEPKACPDRESIWINVDRCGEWMPADELLAAVMEALTQQTEVTLNLDKVDHLDASALQILLAFDAEQRKSGRHLQLVNASASLCQWFEYSGAASHFSRIN